MNKDGTRDNCVYMGWSEEKKKKQRDTRCVPRVFVRVARSMVYQCGCSPLVNSIGVDFLIGIGRGGKRRSHVSRHPLRNRVPQSSVVLRPGWLLSRDSIKKKNNNKPPFIILPKKKENILILLSENFSLTIFFFFDTRRQ